MRQLPDSPFLPRLVRNLAYLAAGLVLALAVPLGAQEQALPPHTIAGEVVHDESGTPIAEATVVLATATPGVLPTAEATAVPVARSTRTGADGRYRFDGIPDGRYVLRVHRMGYRAAMLEVELRGADSRVSVGLAVVPIRLSPVEVTALLAEGAGIGDPNDRARVAVAQGRQRRFLGTDVRELTRGDIAQSLALGDADLFRALQRLPGVGAESDWSAELQTRGARWDQTRVLFDGLPLFNPVHVGGLLSGVSSDAVGAAFLHPGVRPAAIGEGGAAVLDVQSRPGGGDGDRRGVAELSLLNARATLEQRIAGGRGAWMLAARRSHADVLVPLFQSRNDLGRFHFSDIVGRLDWQFAGGSTLEVSALRSRDVEQGGMYDPAYPPYDTAAAYREEASRWGNVAARVTLATPVRTARAGDVLARHTVGASGNDSRWGRVTAVSRSREPFVSRVGYAKVEGEYAPVVAGGLPPRWNAGWSLVKQQARSSGWLRSRFTGDFFQPDTVARLAGSTTQLALWGERRLRPATGLEVSPGLRVETGDAIRSSGRLRVAPRLAARRVLADSATFLSAGVGRSWQYAQAIPPFRRYRADNQYSLPLWVMADDATSAQMTDLATLGAERWLGARWHGSVNGYVRRTRGLLFSDPAPGAFSAKRLLVEGAERARGVDASLRRLEGRWTMAAGYSWGLARSEAGGWDFASPADRRHAFDLTAGLHVGKGVRLGAAFSTATGTPYTRTIGGATNLNEDGEREWVTLPSADVPSGGRFPSFASLDVMLEWNGTFRGMRTGAWLQAYNVLMRENPAFLQSSFTCGVDAGPGCRPADVYSSGLLPIPVVGFRLSF